MPDHIQRRSLTELELRSTVFECTLRLDQASTLGTCTIEFDTDTLEVPVDDLPELIELLQAAQRYSREPHTALDQKPPQPGVLRHPAGSGFENVTRLERKDD